MTALLPLLGLFLASTPTIEQLAPSLYYHRAEYVTERVPVSHRTPSDLVRALSAGSGPALPAGVDVAAPEGKTGHVLVSGPPGALPAARAVVRSLDRAPRLLWVKMQIERYETRPDGTRKPMSPMTPLLEIEDGATVLIPTDNQVTLSILPRAQADGTFVVAVARQVRTAGRWHAEEQPIVTQRAGAFEHFRVRFSLPPSDAAGGVAAGTGHGGGGMVRYDFDIAVGFRPPDAKSGSGAQTRAARNARTKQGGRS